MKNFSLKLVFLATVFYVGQVEPRCQGAYCSSDYKLDRCVGVKCRQEKCFEWLKNTKEVPDYLSLEEQYNFLNVLVANLYQLHCEGDQKRLDDFLTKVSSEEYDDDEVFSEEYDDETVFKDVIDHIRTHNGNLSFSSLNYDIEDVFDVVVILIEWSYKEREVFNSSFRSICTPRPECDYACPRKCSHSEQDCCDFCLVGLGDDCTEQPSNTETFSGKVCSVTLTCEDNICVEGRCYGVDCPRACDDCKHDCCDKCEADLNDECHGDISDVETNKAEYSTSPHSVRHLCRAGFKCEHLGESKVCLTDECHGFDKGQCPLRCVDDPHNCCKKCVVAKEEACSSTAICPVGLKCAYVDEGNKCVTDECYTLDKGQCPLPCTDDRHKCCKSCVVAEGKPCHRWFPRSCHPNQMCVQLDGAKEYTCEAHDCEPVLVTAALDYLNSTELVTLWKENLISTEGISFNPHKAVLVSEVPSMIKHLKKERPYQFFNLLWNSIGFGYQSAKVLACESAVINNTTTHA